MSTQYSMKNICAIGIDDGYFPPEKRGITTIATILYEDKQPKDVIIDFIKVDGKDATKIALKTIKELEAPCANNVVFLDGVTYAGFNYIDPDQITHETSYPVIIIFYKQPDKRLVYEALKKHFTDWEERWSIIGRVLSKARSLLTPKGRIDYYSTISDQYLIHYLITYYQFYSRIPEPLKTADLIASEASRFFRGLKNYK